MKHTPFNHRIARRNSTCAPLPYPTSFNVANDHQSLARARRGTKPRKVLIAIVTVSTVWKACDSLPLEPMSSDAAGLCVPWLGSWSRSEPCVDGTEHTTEFVNNVAIFFGRLCLSNGTVCERVIVECLKTK